jgi:hypothetical protein
MANNLNKSDSNNILKTILIILIVIGVAYIIYYLYNKYESDNNNSNNNSNNKNYVQSENINIQQNKVPIHNIRHEEEINNTNYGMKGKPSGLKDPIMDKTTYLPKGNIVGENVIEHFSTDQDYAVKRNLTSFPKEQLTAEELLPQDNSSLWAQVNPSGEGSLKDRNFLQAGYHIGINTVGQTLRNANLQLRSEPPCPQVKVSPFLNSTIEPDVSRKPFEIGGCM